MSFQKSCQKQCLQSVVLATLLAVATGSPRPALAQVSNGSGNLRFGIEVPPDVDRITSRALQYLASAQLPEGNWPDGHDSHKTGRENTGVTGLALMAMLSTGSDPNSGPYAAEIRAAVRYIIVTQNPKTGFLPNTMYNHGFAMLALAEAYGTVDESILWLDLKTEVAPERRRKLGEALRLAVDCAIRSQRQNPKKSWRYGPDSKDADTSVAGAVLIGLLAARNAGVPVPDESLNDGLEYMKSVTNRRNGEAGYTMAGISISSGGNMSATVSYTHLTLPTIYSV